MSLYSCNSAVSEGKLEALYSIEMHQVAYRMCLNIAIEMHQVADLAIEMHRVANLAIEMHRVAGFNILQ